MTIDNLKDNFEKQRKTAEEISSLYEDFKNSRNDEERKMISSQINFLKDSMKKTGENVIGAAESVSLANPLNTTKPVFFSQNDTKLQQQFPAAKKEKTTALEKLTLKRMKQKEVKVVQKKEKKPNLYVKLASSLFYNKAMSLINRGKFYSLRRDLIRANLEFVPASYVSVIFFTTLISFFASIFTMLFFLFFSLTAAPPFIVATETGPGLRFLQVFWIIFAVPAAVFIFAYFYPSMEKKSLESKINNELPFATIHMSSISNSMLEPSKIFSIIISTGEYPNLEKEFTKLLNEVNVYGYDLVSALRDMAFNSPSRKLADVYNGLATTINSGGDLPEFFDKRAQTLLFEHRLEQEKQSKAAETFMDIYISVVIAAPMILMLLLMMMRVSGLGISLSTSMITLVMVLSVSVLNILFLAFLQLKQPTGG
ncbi:MAG: type II secretion system F family protein [Candidatus Pacearchaeota archaeon]|nr:type II secretion system F family protein [Candidatus Pacearchaeota archaeon]